MEKIMIIGAKRTAIGRFMGTLSTAEPAKVCAQVLKDGFEPKILGDVQRVIIGQVMPALCGQGLARQIALSAGIPQRTPAYSVNMVCGSGMQAIENGMNEIRCGCDVVLCGGVEFMSRVPHALRLRAGSRLGTAEMTDLLVHDGLTDAMSGVHMGVTAENVAKLCGITRQEQDEYAYLTLQRAIAAVDAGHFAKEIVPVQVPDAKGRPVTFDTDEHMNRTSSPEKLSRLRPAFLPEGTVTAGNASGLNDGAAFVLLASQRYCQANGITPLAELVAGVSVGCDPQLMGLGPHDAICTLLEENGLTLAQIDCIELNEAFAAQALGCMRKLEQTYGVSHEWMLERTNRYGSGLGLGHPLGATGARITVTLADSLSRGEGTLGIASLCIGGGMGAALLLRAVR